MPNNTNVNPSIAKIAFSGPVPGESWCKFAPRQANWQHPPKFVQLDEACNWLLDRMLEKQHLKELLNMMEAGMSIEMIARTVLFTGFTMGLWSPSLMMLMTKPIILALVGIAKRAGLNDTPVVHPESFHKYHDSKLQKHRLQTNLKLSSKAFNNLSGPPDSIQNPQQQPTPPQPQGQGFMARPNGVQ